MEQIPDAIKTSFKVGIFLLEFKPINKIRFITKNAPKYSQSFKRLK